MSLFKEKGFAPHAAAALALVVGLILVGLSAPAHADGPGCAASLAGESVCGQEPIGSYSPTQDSDAGTATGSGRFVANPVDVISGAKLENRVDYRAFGSRLSFSRRYNSATGGINRGIGVNWRHAYDLTLARLPENRGLRLTQANGIPVDFYKHDTIAGHWDSTNEQYGSITLEDRHYVWAVPDGRNITFPGVRPGRIEWPDGDVLELYWQNNKLVRIQDRHERALTLHWTPGERPMLRSFDAAEEQSIPGHLERIDLPDGTSIEYRYDNLHRLRAVFSSERYRDSYSEHYRYDDNLESALTSLTDENGTRQWRYRHDGRVDLFTERDGRTLSFEYRDLTLYGDDLTGESGSTDVIREDGTTVTYDWHADHDDGAVLDRVVEYPCESCLGEALDITPERAQASTKQATPSTPESVEGVRVERLGASDADVYADALGEKLTVRFNRRAQVVDLSSAGDATQPNTLEQTLKLRTLTRDLESSSTVDMRSGSIFNGEPTTTICPIAITRTCSELRRDRQLAWISDCAYREGGCDVSGWAQLDGQVVRDELGIDPSLLNDRNFRAVVYRNETTRELAVGFRGTQSMGDLAVDAWQFGGHHSETYLSAIHLARQIGRVGQQVTYTGHSLGGGLATAAALEGGQQAVGFNSASLTVGSAERYGLDIEDADRLVTHLLVPGELVTGIQETPMRDPLGSGSHNDYGPNPLPWETHPAPGRRDVLNPPRNPDTGTLIAGGLALHRMSSVIAALNATIDARCN